MIDYEYKARLLAEGLPDLSKKVSVAQWLDYAHKEPKPYTMPIFTANVVDTIMTNDRPEDWNESKKINRAEFARSVRLYHRIEDMLVSSSEGSLFLTLTFTNDTLASTNEQTRRKYVSRFLKSCGARYVANVDYGAQRGREHYHAVVAAPSIDLKAWHEYGAIKAEKIRVYDATSKSLGKYVSKLSNHAIKITAKRCALMYSR